MRLTRHFEKRGLSLFFVVCVLSACNGEESVSGNAENGRLLLRQFGCGACHRIPGVADAQGKPQNMVRWLRHPQAVNPRSAMPDLGVTERDAHDIAAYLSTLR